MGKRRGDRPRSRRRRSSRSRQGFRLESLEPRLLLSADPLGTLQELAAESLGAGEGAVQLMDAFDPNDALGTATDVGVGPGIHLVNLELDDADANDWYRFELLRADDLDIEMTFLHATGDLDLAVTDALGTVLGSSSTETDGELVSLVGLSAGTYYIRATGVDGAINTYDLSVEPGAGSSTRVIYVNDGETADDIYTTAVGSDVDGAGLTPDNPLRSLSGVLSAFALDSNDLIAIDTGTYTGGNHITIDDQGAVWAGSPKGSDIDGWQHGFWLEDADFNIFYGLTFTDNIGILSWADPGDVSENNTIRNNSFNGWQTAILLNDGASTAIIDNTVSGDGLQGIYAERNSDLEIRGNQVTGCDVAVELFRNSNVEISFNRIHENETGIKSSYDDNLTIEHNIIYRNTGQGIWLKGADVAVVSGNTIYAPVGDGVRVDERSNSVGIENNILWTENGYGLYIAGDSHLGVQSDYNNLYASGNGKVAWLDKAFGDLRDWQNQTGFDLHSIGRTAIAPFADDPQFVDLGSDDYHLREEVSTSIDAGDPNSAYGNEPGANGARRNLGAYGNTADAATSLDAFVAISFPDYYTDWTVGRGQAITWSSYGLDAEEVSIDLYEQGGGFHSNIATVAADAGSYVWTPEESGLSGDHIRRFTIRISAIDTLGVSDESLEAFSVPRETNTYYINDDNTLDDEDPFGTSAPGDDWNTGADIAHPKATLQALIRSYDLGPGDEVLINTGEYIYVRNVTIGFEDEGLLLRGPADPEKVAILNRANPDNDSTNLDIDGADFVDVRDLTLTGADYGIWVHNSSTNFDGRRLTVTENVRDGIRVESGASASSLDSLTAFDNGRYGIYVGTEIASISNSEVYGNSMVGIYLSDAGDIAVEGNEVYENGSGIYVSNRVDSTLSVVGNPDLSLGMGNRVHDNDRYGVDARYDVLVAGNTVSGQDGLYSVGIITQHQVEIRRNVVYENRTGISARFTDGLIQENLVYSSIGAGIVAQRDSDVLGNVVRSADTGIRVEAQNTHAYTGRVTNNLVTNTRSYGILVEGAGVSDSDHAEISSNTIHSARGDAVRIEENSIGVELLNNIFWVESGHALSVASDSQAGFSSDFNIFHLTGLGQAAEWQAVSVDSLSTWQGVAFTDGLSIAQDPRFVDPDAGDYHLESDYGSCHEGSLAVMLDVETGLPMEASGDWSVDALRSPGIDRGSEDSGFAEEPSPNGGFINIGAYGNTGQASLSASEGVLLLRPDGGEIWPAEQSFAIRWRSDALSSTGTPALAVDYAAAVLTDHPVSYWRLGESVGSATATDRAGSNDGGYRGAVALEAAGALEGDTAARFYGSGGFVRVADDPVLNPLELSVEAWVNPDSLSDYAAVVTKSTNTSFDDGYGLMAYDGKLVFYINSLTSRVEASIPTGRFSHVVGTYDGRRLSIYVDGQLAEQLVLDATIQHSSEALEIGRGGQESSYGWDGTIDEVALYDRVLTPREVATHHEAGVVATIPIDLELIRDSDPFYRHTIANDVLNDGEFIWTVPDDPALPPGSDYRLRITRDDGSGFSDDSADSFSIAAPIHAYYVNDGSLLDDQYTTVAGDDANDGLTPSTPKASIRAVLEAYNLDVGDVIYVDSGSYLFWANILIDGEDAGLRIQGPTDPGTEAVLDRGNSASGSYVFELDDADGVTLSNLSLIGAYQGIYAGGDSDSDDVTVMDSHIYGNADGGIYMAVSNDNFILMDSTVYGNGGAGEESCGIYTEGLDSTLSGNRVYANAGHGIHTTGGGTTLSGNEVYGNAGIGLLLFGAASVADSNDVYGNSGGGIWASGVGVVVSSNEVRDNWKAGIYAGSGGLAIGNEVYGHTGKGVTTHSILGSAQEFYSGILIDNADAIGNEVYGNDYGISSVEGHGSGLISQNRVYDNNLGIMARADTEISGNEVYSNSVGIDVFYPEVIGTRDNFYGEIANNRIWDNGTGILVGKTKVVGDDHAEIRNNTLLQPEGDAIQLRTVSQTEGTGVGTRLETSIVEGVLIENNILVVGTGSAISVASRAQVGFVSDYNLFHVTGEGHVGTWSGFDFDDRLDWFLELGLDQHSQVVDPQLMDPLGVDGIAGFSRVELGAARIIDDGDVGFSTTGSWVASISSYGGDQLETAMCDPESPESCDATSTATWEFTGLTGGSTYQVAVSLASDLEITLTNAYGVVSDIERTSANYVLTDNGGESRLQVVTQSKVLQRFSDDGGDWFELALVVMVGDTLTVELSNPSGMDKIFADAIRVVEIVGNGGSDADLHLQPGSPGIDSGDPLVPALAEPVPNGARINQGGYGNTLEATPSAVDGVQVLLPNGGEKYLIGDSVPIEIRTWGLLSTQVVAQLNTGDAGAVETWAANAYQTVTYSDGAILNEIDLSGATDPAPEAVYKTYASAEPGAGSQIVWELPAWDGSYELVLHFAEPERLDSGQRVFDIVVNGTTVADDYDIVAEAGTYRKAATLVVPVTVAGGSGIELQLVSETNYALLSGLELRHVVPGGVAAPTVDVEVSSDGGSSWVLVEAGLPLDARGCATTSWIAAAETLEASVRATANDGSLSADESGGVFQIANAGTAYYVNDDSLVGDEYTSAAGNNRNTGKSPDAPMASLLALLVAYDLDPDDTIYVDTGSYTLLGNVVIDSQDAGVSITGPVLVDHEAKLDRDNQLPGSHVFTLCDADGVTLSNLALTGGNSGVYASQESDSDNVTVADCEIYGNAEHGVHLEASNDDAVLTGNKLHDNGTPDRIPVGYGVYVRGSNATLSGNEVYRNASHGIRSTGRDATLSNNDVHDNYCSGLYVIGAGSVLESNQVWWNGAAGIYASGADVWVRSNVVHDNLQAGIYVDGPGVILTDFPEYDGLEAGLHVRNGAVATGNEVFRHTGVDAAGILIYDADAIGNEVYGNEYGITCGKGHSTGVISQNRVFDNDAAGILARAETDVLENEVHSNGVGIHVFYHELLGTTENFYGEIANNRIWGNNTGILVSKTQIVGDDHALIRNNTVLQETGDAIRLETVVQVEGTGSAARRETSVVEGVVVENNILVVAAGSAISVGSETQADFASDYNLFHVTAGGQLVTWSGVDFDDRLDWFLEMGFDHHSQVADPQLVSPSGADGILGYSDGGSDDDLHLAPGSPAIDAGNPLDLWHKEPQPNGGRINQGGYGDTTEAMPSPADGVQVLTPNGAEKYSVGDSVPIEIRSWNLNSRELLAQLNVGDAGALGAWEANDYQTVTYSGGSTSESIDLSGVTDPAPEAIYQSYERARPGVGNQIAWTFPVSDGTYELVLHFAEPNQYGPGIRVFDVVVNNTTVVENYDISAAAGAYRTATTLVIPVTATEGTGIDLTLVNEKLYALLSGLELRRLVPGGVAAPTVNIDVSTDGGGSWTSVEEGLALDEHGRATTSWTATSETLQALVRVTANDGSLPTDDSDAVFLIANSGTVYFVNDQFLSDDEYTTAVGDDRNTGKSPDVPMASLRALLAAYDLGPGDTIYVDTGDYALLSNVLIDAEDSGVSIQGPVQEGHRAQMDRGNTSSGSYVFELDDADGVMLSNLSMTGAYHGVYSSSDSDSDELTIADCEIYGNSGHGVYLESSNDNLALTGCDIYSNGSYIEDEPSASHGIYSRGEGAILSDNDVHESFDRGVYVTGARSVVDSNRVWGNLSEGIYATGVDIVVSSNVVYSNAEAGIYAGDGTLAIGNEVYGHDGEALAGIVVCSAKAIENEVYGNNTGISTASEHSAGVISGNHVYDNSVRGIFASADTLVDRNRINSNPVGLELDTTDEESAYRFFGRVENNLIYDNREWGILIVATRVSGDSYPELVNNTVYQEVGDAIRLNGGNTTDVILRNNIFVIEKGFAIYVDEEAQTNFSSEFNWFIQGTDPEAKIGNWGGLESDSVEQWNLDSGQDDPLRSPESGLGDATFVDPDGADNVLGYDSQGSGYDGGDDDNFQLIAFAAGIDAASPLWAPLEDIARSSRWDDVGTDNGLTGHYEETDLGTSSFVPGGVAQNWQSSSGYWVLALPFSFDFYGTSYTEVYVSSQGLLQFGSTQSITGSPITLAEFITLPRIAALWDDIRTDGTGDDIYVDASIAGEITIRWDATNNADESAVNFSIALIDDAAGDHIEFHYGSGNTNLTPIAGISKGNGTQYLIASTSGQAVLSDSHSLEIDLVPGIVDIGAYEFLGTSYDVTPPTISGALPSGIDSETLVDVHQSTLRLDLSEPMNAIDANALANYELIEAGPNGIVGDADDVVVDIAPNYGKGDLFVLLEIPGGRLTEGIYRLTVSPGDSLRDLAGLPLDGDLDSHAGGAWLREFTVVDFAPTVNAVYINSTSWAPGFQSYLESRGLGAAGYRIPTGGSLQVADLPWVNLDQIVIEFDEQVVVTQGDLEVWGAGTETWTVSGFDYDPMTLRGTWTLDTPLGADKIRLYLSDTVADDAGQALDGEWVDESTDGASGDGVAGGDFRFRFDVLPGNVDDSGEPVDAGDQSQVLAALASSLNSLENYSAFLDVNGDGGMNIQDVILVRNAVGTSLPLGDPGTGSGSAPAGMGGGTAAGLQSLVPQVPADSESDGAAAVVSVVSVETETAEQSADPHVASEVGVWGMDILLGQEIVDRGAKIFFPPRSLVAGVGTFENQWVFAMPSESGAAGFAIRSILDEFGSCGTQDDDEEEESYRISEIVIDGGLRERLDRDEASDEDAIDLDPRRHLRRLLRGLSGYPGLPGLDPTPMRRASQPTAEEPE